MTGPERLRKLAKRPTAGWCYEMAPELARLAADLADALEAFKLDDEAHDELCDDPDYPEHCSTCALLARVARVAQNEDGEA